MHWLTTWNRIQNEEAWLSFSNLEGLSTGVSPDATAFPHRYANNNLVTGSFWNMVLKRLLIFSGLERIGKKVEKFTDGFYINDEFSETQQQVNRNFLGNYDRLVKIKTNTTLAICSDSTPILNLT